MKLLMSVCFVILLSIFGLPALQPGSAYFSARAQQEEMMEEENTQKEESKKEVKKEEKKQVEEMDDMKRLEDQKENEVMQDVPPSSSERMKYFREKYEDTYEKPFEEVWNAVIKSLEDKDCQVLKKTYNQTDQGLYKGNIQSDYCIFATGSDTTMDNLKKYSKENTIPFIRGGVWVTGRFQYKFIMNEKEDGTVSLVLKGEVSGFEEYVTYSVHFWDSNGFLETMMLKKIRQNLGLPEK